MDVRKIVEKLLALDPGSDSKQIQELYLETRARLDPGVDPLDWARLHAMAAPQLPLSLSIEAYEIGIKYLRDDPDLHENASHLACCLLLAQLDAPNLDKEYSIDLHELAVQVDPEWRYPLADLYAHRESGDAVANWRRRIELMNAIRDDVDPQTDSVLWAEYNNEFACALGDEPSGDFEVAMHQRIEMHQRSLAVVGDRDNESRARTHVLLAEAYANLGSSGETGEVEAAAFTQASQYIDQAMRYATDANDESVKRNVLQLRSRIAGASLSGGDDLSELLRSLQVAEHKLGPGADASHLANLLKSQVLLAEEMLAAGAQPEQIKELYNLVIDATDRALALLKGTPGNDYYQLWLARGRILLDVEPHVALHALSCALDEAHRRLRSSITNEGRLEAIRLLRTPASLLAHGHLVDGDALAAIAALERGRAQLWVTDPHSEGIEDPTTLVEDGQVLLLTCTAKAQGWAILVTTAQVEIVPLPQFGAAEVSKFPQNPDKVMSMFLMWLNACIGQRHSNENFSATLDNLGRVLAGAVWAFVIDKFEELGVAVGDQVIMVHDGVAAFLPFHAAWGEGESGRRWVADDYVLSAAPSLASLVPKPKRTSVSQPVESSKVVVIADPNNNLAFENVDIAGVLSAFPDATVIAGDKASPAAVLAAIRDNTVVHVAAHGTHDHLDVWASTLELAGDQDLTLDELTTSLRSAEQCPRLVVLAACETAQTKVTTHDNEHLGFTTALVQAGVGTVIAPAWNADDAGSAFLSYVLYRELAAGVLPARALANAQRWLRFVTINELTEIAPNVAAHSGPLPGQFRRRLMVADPQDTPFSSPWIWAAFTATGGSG